MQEDTPVWFEYVPGAQDGHCLNVVRDCTIPARRDIYNDQSVGVIRIYRAQTGTGNRLTLYLSS